MEPTTLIIMIIANLLIAAIMAPQAMSAKPEALSDIDFPQVEDGTPQAVIFGDCWSGDWCVLAVGNYRTQEVRKSAGKK
jgi:hypothetical protein